MAYYVQVDADYPTHPKTINLKVLIGPEADCYPIRLWTWAGRFARDGVIRGGAAFLEAALGWAGKSGKLHKALMTPPPGYAAGFIDKDGITIHDWMTRTGKDIRAYEDKKEANRVAYLERRKGGKNGKHKSPEEIAAAVAAAEDKSSEEGTPLE